MNSLTYPYTSTPSTQYGTCDAVAYAMCDDSEDCPGGVDEQGCSTNSCQDGSQYPDIVKCDGLNDCDDGSDELNCQ